MGLYLYETHLHTSEASACSVVSGAEQARIYKEAGYTGIIVTDHFFTGNTAIPRNLPWVERVDRFCKGYENAKKEGDKLGLSVFFGWESNFSGTEFLIYGLDHEWMRNHPEMLYWSVEEQYYYIHEAGGYVVHAHPFRDRDYIKEIRLFPDCADAVEAYNIGNRSKECDRKALEYAKKHKLPAFAGSDSHGIDSDYYAMGFNRPLDGIHDFITCVKAGDYSLILDI